MSVVSPVLFSSGKDDWQTPPALFAALDREFGFRLDAAATRASALCDAWRGPDHPDNSCRNGLIFDWDGPVYLNPPYSRGLQGKFIAKAAAEQAKGVTTVMLIPARTDTKAFHAHIWDASTHKPRTGVEVRLLPGRLRFVGATHGAPFPSMVVVFRGVRVTWDTKAA